MEPQAPTRGSGVARGGNIAVMVIDLVLLAGLAVGTIYHRGRFTEVFDDFETELPGLTQALLSVPGWLIILGALVAGMAVGLKEALIPDARAKLLLNLAVLVGLLGLGVLLVLALVLPVVTLIEKLS